MTRLSLAAPCVLALACTSPTASLDELRDAVPPAELLSMSLTARRAQPPSAQDSGTAMWGPIEGDVSHDTLAVQQVSGTDFEFFLGGWAAGSDDEPQGVMGGTAHGGGLAHRHSTDRTAHATAAGSGARPPRSADAPRRFFGFVLAAS